jgi:hypothetical protein
MSYVQYYSITEGSEVPDDGLRTSETSVYFNETTRHCFPEASTSYSSPWQHLT